MPEDNPAVCWPKAKKFLTELDVARRIGGIVETLVERDRKVRKLGLLFAPATDHAHDFIRFAASCAQVRGFRVRCFEVPPTVDFLAFCVRHQHAAAGILIRRGSDGDEIVCGFRSKSITDSISDSGPSRSPIPVDVDHPEGMIG